MRQQTHSRWLACAAGVLGLIAASAHAGVLALPSQRAGMATLPETAALTVDAIDADKALAEDATRSRSAPLRYALERPAAVSVDRAAKAFGGQWDVLPDGRALWRMTVRVPGAISIDLGFSKMWLPHGAELYVLGADNKTFVGPYSDADNSVSGEFWTPVVPGDHAQIELVVPAQFAHAVTLDLGMVHGGYRDIWSGQAAGAKSGSCNVDTACPVAEPYREQIRAVARYSVAGGLCTGELINNTANNGRPLFITAHHCFSTQTQANGIVVYWRYENPTCRTPGSTASGTPLSVAGNSVTQTGGATLLAATTNPDTNLVELRTAIPAAANPYWYGWDHSENIPTMGVSIHHPNGDEKRIAIQYSPLSLDDQAENGVPGTLHWKITDYDVGTTEPGSSGSGLFNQDKRLIGVLSGGAAACASSPADDADGDGDNDGDDYYGRLSKAWEGDGSSSTRVRDYLDPGNSGVLTLEGRDSCATPNVNLSGPASTTAGAAVSFSVAPTGGTGPYTVDWDVGNDNVFDRSRATAGINGNTSLSMVFPSATNTTIAARVTDATGCRGFARQALVVNGPAVSATPGALTEVCGNGDAVIDPGERWRVNVALANSGGAALSNGYAAVAPRFGSAATIAATDSFGYRATRDPGYCTYNYIDLTGSATPLALTAAGTAATAADDGRAAPIAVQSFNFYGSAVTSLVMSTNGYLTPDTGDLGGDFTNSCGPDSGSAARLYPLHDDLVVQTGATNGLRHQFFPTCPRPAESISGNTPCEVFEWTGMGQFDNSGNPQGNADFEAIVYPATGQIVYQYKRPPNDNGLSASIGAQSNGGAAALSIGCNGATVAASQAICLLPPSVTLKDFAEVNFAATALPVANLPAGGQTSVAAEFKLSSTAGCGTPYAVRYVGAVDANAASMQAAPLVSGTTPTGCHPTTQCGFPLPVDRSSPQIQEGLFANSNRFGNGIGSFVIMPPAAARPTYFGLWFTGEANRNPTWYAIQGDIEGNTLPTAGAQPLGRGVLYSARMTSASPFQNQLTVVGEGLIHYLTPTRYLFTWTNGSDAGGEIQDALYPTRTSPNRTGAWYSPAEAGWGSVIDDHKNGGADEQVMMEFLYDAAGSARWTLGGAGNVAGPMSQTTFQVHCPSCASFPDFFNFPLAAGSLTRSYSDLTHGSLTTAIVYPSPLTGSWTRSATVAIVPLTSPGPQ